MVPTFFRYFDGGDFDKLLRAVSALSFQVCNASNVVKAGGGGSWPRNGDYARIVDTQCSMNRPTGVE